MWNDDRFSQVLQEERKNSFSKLQAWEDQLKFYQQKLDRLEKGDMKKLNYEVEK